MVTKTVTIDGQDIEVLVPQVYIVNRPHVTSAGALVSGKNATIQSDSDIHSSGTIVAKEQLSISANNLDNAGLMAGDKVSLTAKEALSSSGTLTADSQLMLDAGKDINFITTTHTQERNNNQEHDIKTVLDKVSTVSVKNGDMTIKAGHDINAVGALIVNQDKKSTTLLEAGNDINVSAVKMRDKEEFYISDKDYQRADVEHVVGSEIDSQGNISLKAKHDINVTASSVNADNALAIDANNVHINSESASQRIDVHQEVVTKGTFSKTKSVFDLDMDNHVQTGSSLSGKTIDVNAKQDIDVVGANIVAADDLTMNAVNNIGIKSSQETYYQKQNVTTKTSGLMSSGGLGLTMGKEKESTTKTDTEYAYQKSTIGSTAGSVTMRAGQDVAVTGSDVIAKNDVNLTGENVTLESDDAKTTYKEAYQYQKSGLTVAITGTAADVYDAAVAINRAKEKGNDALLALQSIKSGLTGIEAIEDLKLKNKDGQTQASIGVSVMAGTQKTEREVNQAQHSVIGSGVSAGQNITITAAGNAQKEDGDITLKGSEVRAGNDITLDANRDLNVIGAVNTQHSDSDEKSYGGAVGIQFQIGGDESGFRFKGNANFSRERENADGSAWSESVINAGNTLTTKTGNDTTMIGGQVNGDTIKMDVGNNLNIQSLQDTDNYDYDKISASVSGSGGSGFSANLALSKTDIESNWASVTDQSGIFAGKGGFDITVGNNTDLQGAVIASSAEDKTHNILDTGTISFSNIENKADFDVSSMSMSIGTSGGPSPTAGMPTIYHNSGHDHSTTASAVEDGSLTVRNQDEQQQNINQLSRDTANANNPLAQLFNKQKELDKIEAIELVRDIAAQAKSIANKYDRIQAQNDVDKNGIDKDSKKEARDELGPDATEQQVNSLAYRYAVDKQVINNQKTDNPDNKNIGGMGSSLSKGIDAATSIVTGLITGDITGGLAGASAPYLAEQIKLATGHKDPKTGEWKTDDKAANLTAHALLGAAVAIAQGNSALAGGAGALAGEAAADFIREKLYNKDVKDLSEAEKENISALSQLAVGLAVAAGTGGSASDIGTAVAGSKNAVENNALTVIPTPAGPIPMPIIIPGVNDVDANKELALALERALKNIGKSIDDFINKKGEVNIEEVKEVLSPAEQKRLNERLEIAYGGRPKVSNIDDYMKDTQFGQVLTKGLELQGYDASGNPIYQAVNGGAGNYIWKDDMVKFDSNKDVILVYSKNGQFLSALNLDGSKNDTLTDIYKGGTLSTVANHANNRNDKDKQPENHLVSGGSVAVGGDPGLPPDDNENKDREKDDSKADNKNSNSSNNSVKDNQTVDKLNQKQESAVKKIDNLVKNSIKDHDIEGALKDMEGNPVPKADGSGYWNHLKELQDTLNGLRNHANTLKDVNNPTAQAARQKALEAIERIESAIKGYGL